MTVAKIALCGKMRSGKDTVGDYLVGNYTFTPLAFGDKLKEIAHLTFPWIPNEPKPREMYQFMNVMRDFSKDVWVRHVDIKVKKLKEKGVQKVVVTDLRQPNEYEWAKENGFTIVRVSAEEEVRIQRMRDSGDEFDPESLNHKTEIYIDDFDVDYEIENNGTLEDLESKIVELIEKVLQ